MESDTIKVRAKVLPSPQAFFWDSKINIYENKLKYHKSFIPPISFIVSIFIFEIIFLGLKISDIINFTSDPYFNYLIFLVSPLLFYLIHLISPSVIFDKILVINKKMRITFFGKGILEGKIEIKFRTQTEFQHVLKSLDKRNLKIFGVESDYI